MRNYESIPALSSPCSSSLAFPHVHGIFRKSGRMAPLLVQAARLMFLLALMIAMALPCNAGDRRAPSAVGKVITWGNPGGPAKVEVNGLSGTVAITGGLSHRLALKSDGTVWAWGWNAYGQLGNGTTSTTETTIPNQVSRLSGMVAIAAGYYHSVALKSDGTVWAWGRNDQGQLGDSSGTDQYTPVEVSGLTDVIAIASGSYHVLALKADGTIWTWGLGSNGQLGNNSTSSSSMPIQVSALTGVSAIAAGGANSLALKSDGTVWAWGNNEHGQVGYGQAGGIQLTPLPVSGLIGVSAIASGDAHNLALKNGTVWTWGFNASGQLGNDTVLDQSTPVQAIGLAGITAVAGGTDDSLALSSDGMVWGWGRNYSGAVGDGTTTERNTPVAATGLAGVVAVAAGGGFSLALQSEAVGVAWGYNYYGEIGDGSTAYFADAPAQVSGLTGLTAVSAGEGYSLALRSDGTVWGWGSNNTGQLGNGTSSDTRTPVQVGGRLAGVTAVTTAGSTSLALTSDGSVWAWGYQYGSAPAPLTALSNITAVAGGLLHRLALASDGTVWAWGDNRYGQLGDGTIANRSTPARVVDLSDRNGYLSGVMAIAAGEGHSLALKSDGTIWAWGDNQYGQLGSGLIGVNQTRPVQVARIPTLTGLGAVAIDAGRYHSLALTSDGMIWVWGRNDHYQLGNGGTFDRVGPGQVLGGAARMAAGSSSEHTLALLSDGSLWGWGLNNAAQLRYGVNTGTPVQSYSITAPAAMSAGDEHTLTLALSAAAPPPPSQALTITASDAVLTYGTPSPDFAYSVSGGNVTLDSNPTCTSPRTPNSAVGAYLITCSGAVASNYTIEYVPGTLTVDPAPLTVTANSQTMAYGSVVPTLTASYLPTNAVLSGTPALATTATSTSKPGSYLISVAQGSLLAPNYFFVFVSGTMTVTPAVGGATQPAIAVTSNWNPSGALQPITFTATVSGSVTPSGSVQFQIDGVNLGDAVALGNGAATSPAAISLSLGSHLVTAIYSGDAVYSAATGTLPQTVTLNYLHNPGLDTDLSEWINTGSAQWIRTDANSSSGSGSAQLMGGPVGANGGWSDSMWQCFPVQAGRSYNVGAKFFVPSGQDAGVIGEAWLGWYPDAQCTGGTIIANGGMLQSSTVDMWVSTRLTATAPAGSRYAALWVGSGRLGGGATSTRAYVDDLFFQPADALNFFNNYFVTGDQVNGVVDLRSVAPVNGLVTGNIDLAGVPAGADLVAAYLYWQMVEDPTAAPGGYGYFRRYPIFATVIGEIPYSDTWGGRAVSGVLRAYRANVLAYLPIGAGSYQPNGSSPVSFQGTNAAGASLVVIYRLLSNPRPALRAVVMYDGVSLTDTAGQSVTARGFYDAVGTPDVTLISSGTAINSSTSGLQGYDQGGGTVLDRLPVTSVTAGRLTNLVVSVPVNASDGDGLLDAWKAGPPSGDPHFGNPGYYDVWDGSWVDLPGAVAGQKDIFVQIDYMVGAGHSHRPSQESLDMMRNAFASHRINLHYDIRNAIPEETCTADDTTAVPKEYCAFPNEPGVVVWKSGVEDLKAAPRDPAACAAGGDCSPNFPPGRKDSYHYLGLDHSLGVASWSMYEASLKGIDVVAGASGSPDTATIRTSDRTRPEGGFSCPTRVTIDGALGALALNGVYDVNPGSCTATTFTINTSNVLAGTYDEATPSTLPEPLLAVTSSVTNTISGYSDVFGATSVVTLGKWGADADRVNVQAGTGMHEFGHTLGLTHGGIYDNAGVLTAGQNCKPNYQSVMNYLFQVDLLGQPDVSHPYGYLDFSSQVLNPLDESSLSSIPGLASAAYNWTKWYSPNAPFTGAATAWPHCDGTPLGAVEPAYYLLEGPTGAIAWLNGQNIHFGELPANGVADAVLEGYNDWINTDLQQISAAGNDYVSEGGGGIARLPGGGIARLPGGGLARLPGGGLARLPGGGIARLPGGGIARLPGGGLARLPGGGLARLPGGGLARLPGGGKPGDAEITHLTANSYPHPPRAVTVEGGTVNFGAASFGDIQQYNVYRVVDGTRTLIATIPSDPVELMYSYTDPYWSGFTNPTYLVTTIDISDTGTVRESTPPPPMHDQAPLTLIATSPLPYGQSEALSVAGGSTGGSVTYTLQTGPCDLAGSRLTAKSSTGSCVVTATMAGSDSYWPLTSAATVSLTAWTLKGFDLPVSMTAKNTVKGGSTVPLMFNIYAGGAELKDTTAVRSFSLAPADCTALSALASDPVDFTTTGGTSLRYDTTAGHFVQNWKTPKQPGTCYAATMTAQDGSQLKAYFELK